MDKTADLPEHIGEYNNDGFTIFRNAIDASLVAETRSHIDWLLEQHPGTRPEMLTHDMITRDAFWVRLVSDPRLLDIAEAFLGSDLALFASHYICKPPGIGQAVLYHQDGGYWPLEPMEVVTLWLAVDRSDQGNGCMKIIPGTQDSDLKEVQKRSDIENVLGSGIDESYVDEDRAVDVVLDPGDVSVHHPNIIHGSYANTSERWRRGLTIRYIPTSTRIVTESSNPDIESSVRLDAGPFPSAFLLRGSADSGVNIFNAWPNYNPDSSVDFAGSDRWNERIKPWNEKNAHHLRNS